MTEELKPIPNLPDYLISESGDIYSYKRKVVRKLKHKINIWGYATIKLSRPDKTKFTAFVHRLVAYAWIGECPIDKEEINHKDGNKLNNHYSNLEWVTKKENQQHRRKVLGKNKSGSKCVPVICINKNTGDKFEFSSVAEACNKLNLHRVHVREVIRGARKSDHGYIIKRKEN